MHARLPLSPRDESGRRHAGRGRAPRQQAPARPGGRCRFETASVPSVTWQAAVPGHGAGRPRRPRGRHAASERPRREGLPRSLAVACSAMRLLTPHTSTKQAGLPRGGISHALAYISLDLRVSPCISPHLPGGAASRRGQLAAARAPDCAGVRRPDAPRARRGDRARDLSSSLHETCQGRGGPRGSSRAQG